MNTELWATIRRMHSIDRQSISEIARQLRIHRQTVRRALEYVSGPPDNEARGAAATGKLEPYKAYIAERLKK